MPPSYSRPGCSLVIDVSAAQPPTFDFAAAKALGAVAVIAKGSEGETYVDPLWPVHARRAAEAGLMVGSYHVFRPEHPDPTVQARFYRDQGRALTMLCPIIDLELLEGIAPELVAERAAVFMEACGPLWGKTTGLVYISPSFAATLAAKPAGAAALKRLARWPLWLADYEPIGHTPKPWTSWAGWQWEGGFISVNGVPVDMSWFAGDAIAIAKLGETL